MTSRSAARVSPVGDTRARFGEGPVWDADRGVVHWVDITGGRFLSTSPDTGITTSVELGGEVAAVFPTTAGTLLVARDHELLEIPVGAGAAAAHTLTAIEPRPRMRFNDGGVDARGRLLIGTLHADKATGTAALYRLRSTGATPIVTDLTVANGTGWSPDGAVLYHVDTPTLRIDAHEYDAVNGTLGRRWTLADVSDSPGRPDGLTVDADGHVWVAMIRGGELRRYSPDGHLDRVIDLPVSHPTSVCFGGERLDRLFVTCARDPLDAAEIERQPLAGRLLEVEVDTVGLPQVPVALPPW